MRIGLSVTPKNFISLNRYWRRTCLYDSLGHDDCYENCGHLGYHTASSGNFSRTFRGNLSVPTSGVLSLGPIGCPETSVRYYQYSLHNNTEERSSHLLRGGGLKSRTHIWVCVLRHVLKRNPPNALVSDVYKNGRTPLLGVETVRLSIYLLETQEFCIPENTIHWIPLWRIRLQPTKYLSQPFSIHKTL
jgi:hypothetical protein